MKKAAFSHKLCSNFSYAFNKGKINVAKMSCPDSWTILLLIQDRESLNNFLKQTGWRITEAECIFNKMLWKVCFKYLIKEQTSHLKKIMRHLPMVSQKLYLSAFAGLGCITNELKMPRPAAPIVLRLWGNDSTNESHIQVRQARADGPPGRICLAEMQVGRAAVWGDRAAACGLHRADWISGTALAVVCHESHTHINWLLCRSSQLGTHPSQLLLLNRAA